ncbi:MAG: diguanylate cyclase [Pseudomonadota bacterium]
MNSDISSSSVTAAGSFQLLLDRLVRIGSVSVAFVGVVVLCGWLFHIPVLTQVLPSFASMKVNTACALLASAVTVWCLHTGTSGSRRFLLARVLAVAVLALSSLTFAEDFFGLELGIDQFIVANLSPATHIAHFGRMSPATSFSLVFLGLALLTLKARRSYIAVLTHWLVVCPLVVSALAIMGYTYGVSALYEVRPYASIAIHTAVSLLVLSLCLLATDSEHGFARISTSDTAGGSVSRRLLPTIPLMLFVLGWIQLEGQSLGLYDTRFGLALMVLLSITTSLIAVGSIANTLHKVDLVRSRSEASVLALNADLNVRIQSERRFRLTLSSSPIGLAEVELNGRFADVNPALCAMLGYSQDELMSKTFQDITHPDDLALDLAHVDDLLKGTYDSYRMEKRYFHKSGRIVHIQLDAATRRDETGKPIGFISQIQNIDERNAIKERLRWLIQMHTLAVRAGHIGIWQWEIKSGLLTWDAQMYDMYGIADGTPVSYENWKNAVHPEDVEEADAVLKRTVETRSTSRNNFRIVHPTRGIRHIEASEEVIVDAENNVLATVGVNQDVTERRQMEESLRIRQAEIVELALTDSLTGIANRRRLDERLEVECNRVRRYGGTLTVALADLDHFKRVNDEFGHAIGDSILKAFSRLMESHIRETDFIARFGGEEFVIVMPHTDLHGAQMLVERLRADLEQSLIPPLAHSVTASFGIAQLLSDETVGSVLRRADRALYQAKATGRNRAIAAAETKGISSTGIMEQLPSMISRF